jgi:flagellar operon protein
MSELINGISVPFLPIGGVDALAKKKVEHLPSERSFDSVFSEELEQIKFSKHAQQRLESRNIQLSEREKADLNSAVSKAEAKGAQESLVLLRDMAFVVNVKNKTIVTALTGDSMNNNVFTNIDSAIIVPHNQ